MADVLERLKEFGYNTEPDPKQQEAAKAATLDRLVRMGYGVKPLPKMPTEEELYQQQLDEELRKRSGGMMDYLPGPVKDVASAAAGYASDMAGVGLRGSAAAENLVRGLIPDSLEGAAGFALRTALPGVGHVVTAASTPEMSRKKLDLANDLQKTSQAFDEAVDKARGDGVVGWARKMGTGALRSGANMLTGSLAGGVPGALALAGATEASNKYGELERKGESEASQLGWATAHGVWESTFGFLLNKILPGNEKLISDALKGEMKKLWKMPLKEAAKEVYKEQRNAQIDEQITELGHLGMSYADGTTEYVSPEETMWTILRTMRDTAGQTLALTGGVQTASQLGARAAEKRDGTTPFGAAPQVSPQTPPAAPVTTQTPSARPPQRGGLNPPTTPRPIPREELEAIRAKGPVSRKDAVKAGVTGDQLLKQETRTKAVDDLLEKAKEEAVPVEAPAPVVEAPVEPWKATRKQAQDEGWGDNWSSVVRRGVNQGKDVPQPVLDELAAYDAEKAAKQAPAKPQAPAPKVGDTVVRYTHKSGTGLLNNSELDRSKLTDEEEAELVELMDLGLKQPPEGTKGTFYFTQEGEKQHARMLELLTKASKSGIVRTESQLGAEPSWQSDDGQLAVEKSAGKKPTPVPAATEPTIQSTDQTDIERAVAEAMAQEDAAEEAAKVAAVPAKKARSARKPSKEAEALADRAAKGEAVERPADVSEARWKAMVAQKAKRLGMAAPKTENKPEQPRHDAGLPVWEMTKGEFDDYAEMNGNPLRTQAHDDADFYEEAVNKALDQQRRNKGRAKAWLTFEQMAKDLQLPDDTTYWEMIQRGRELPVPTHEEAVKRALSEGKAVSERVLADYPDLKPKPASKPPKRRPVKNVAEAVKRVAAQGEQEVRGTVSEAPKTVDVYEGDQIKYRTPGGVEGTGSVTKVWKTGEIQIQPHGSNNSVGMRSENVLEVYKQGAKGERATAAKKAAAAEEAAKPKAGTDVVIGKKSLSAGVDESEVTRLLQHEQEKGKPAWFEASTLYTLGGKYTVDRDAQQHTRLTKMNDLSSVGLMRQFEMNEYTSYNKAAQELYDKMQAERKSKSDLEAQDKAEKQAISAERSRRDTEAHQTVREGVKSLKGKVQDIDVATEADSTMKVKATVYGDLAVQKTGTKPDKWKITHVPSGLGLPHEYSTKKQAVEAVWLLSHDMDWSQKQPPDEVFNEARRRLSWLNGTVKDAEVPELGKGPQKRQPSAEMQAAQAEKTQAGKDLLREARKLKSFLPGAVNPELALAAVKYLKAAVKLEYFRFKDFVKYVISQSSKERALELDEYLQAAWKQQGAKDPRLDKPSSVQALLGGKKAKPAPKAKGTPLGKPVVGREGAVYRAFDEPEDAAPKDRGVSFNRDQPFGYGGGYEIEVVRPKGEEVQHHPGHEMGILNPNDVTRLFYEPGYFNENAHDAIAEDLKKLRRMFPNAEFVRVEMDLESPDEARIAVPHGEFADAVKPVPAKATEKPAPKSNWQDSVLSVLAGKTKVDQAVTLPELWAQVEKANPGLTMEEFKQGLLKLHESGKIKLEDQTGSWEGILDNPLAIRGKDFDEKRGYGLKWWVRGVAPVESPVKNPEPPPRKEVPPVDPEKTTSTKNRKTDELRDEIGMPPREKPQREKRDEWEEEAARRIAADKNYPRKLAESLIDKPRPIDKVENAALGQRIQELVNRRDAGEDVLDELASTIMATTVGGSETGRALGSRRTERYSDFSLAGMIQIHIDRVGETPNKEMMAKLEEMAATIAAKDKEIEELRVLSSQERIDALIEAALKNAQKPAPKEKIGTKKERIRKQIVEGVASFKQSWAEAVKAAGSAFTSSGFALNPEALAALGRAAKAAAGLIKSYAELGVESFIELTARIKQDIGDLTAEQSKIFREEWDKQFAKAESPMGPTPTDPMIGATARDLTRWAVEAGITDREEVIDIVHEQLQRWGIDQTRSETMRSMSGYGSFRELDHGPVATTVRGIKGEIQQLLKLEAMQAGQAPEKTGVERREPTEAERQLIKDVNEAKKKGGYTVTDPKRQLKSALDTAKTTVENALTDADLAIAALEKAIADRVPLAKPEGRTPGPTDAKLDEMKAQLAEKRARRKQLRAEYDTIFPQKRGAMTDARSLKAAETLLKRLNDQLEADIAAGNIMGQEPGTPLTSQVLEEQRARRAELKQALKEAREGSPEYQAKLEAKENERYLKDLQKREAFWQKRGEEAKAGKLPVPKPKKTRTDQRIIDQLVKNDATKRGALAEIEAEKRRRWDIGQKLYAGLSEVSIALPRELMAGLENSVVLRQGWFFTMQAPFHPRIVFSRILDGLQSMFSQRMAMASQEELNQRPNAPEYPLAGIDNPLGKMDELYQSRIVDWLASTENILWFPARWAAKSYIATARGFRTFSTGMKADLYDMMKKDTMGIRRFFNKHGMAKTPEWTESDTKLMGRSANIFAGRGTGLKEGGVLNYLLWAPKWVWSRIQAEFQLPLQMATPQFIGRWNADPAIRLAHAKLYTQAVVGAATHLAAMYFVLSLLAGDDEEKKPTIETDTTSTDLWKLKMGDTRIDVMGGLQQYLVFFSRLWYGTKKTPSGEVIALRGEDANPFKGDMWDEITRQGRYKLGPTASGIIDFTTQKTAVGEILPENPLARAGAIVGKRLVPMTWPDIFQAEKSLGLKQGTVAAIEAFMGASVNTYGDYTKYRDGTPEEQTEQFDKALEKMKWDSPDLPYMDLLTPAQVEQVNTRRDQRRGGVIMDALADPPEPGKAQDVASLGKAVESLQKRQEAFQKARASFDVLKGQISLVDAEKALAVHVASTLDNPQLTKPGDKEPDVNGKKGHVYTEWLPSRSNSRNKTFTARRLKLREAYGK